MKRINYGEVSYLVGDEIADLLVLYVTRLAANKSADTIEINVLGPDGNPEAAIFALTPGVSMTAETTRSELVEPDNTAAEARITEALAKLSPMTAVPMTGDEVREMSRAFEETSDFNDL